jgi:hypothetical protein
MATKQINLGDLIIADYDWARSVMTFVREDQGAVVGAPERAAVDMAAVKGMETYRAGTGVSRRRATEACTIGS